MREKIISKLCKFYFFLKEVDSYELQNSLFFVFGLSTPFSCQNKFTFGIFFPARSAVMHLSFDKVPVKHGDNSVQDDSGNKNDAGLVNGAEISNRTMGKT